MSTTDTATIERIIDAEWHKLHDLWCSDRTPEKTCIHGQGRYRKVVNRKGAICTKSVCPRILLVRHDMETTGRRCYRDKKGYRIYVERFAHNKRPWFIWHEESCAFPPGARSVGGDTTLKGAQAKLDRMAARYGWEPCEAPEWLKDEHG